MARITFREERCKGCELCKEVCPRNIIVMIGDKLNEKGYHPAAVIDMGRCTGCGFCATICPGCVITVEK